MSKSKNHFRSSMITNATKAAAAMQTTPIAAQLAASGFTSATMAKQAGDLADLLAKAEAAKAAWLQASAALQTRAQSFDQTWSSFCNLVRGFTADANVRKALGVTSPGVHKGPTFKRGPRKNKKATPATAPTGTATATPPKPQS